ncbi:MAG: hypothetical protein EXR63_00940 [Dehalococcoidia bacterium]|nr:hypothetical protein [Dehalococcoidia bacterium]
MTNDLLRETYVHGHAPAVVRQHGMRTAEEAAAFLLPEFSPEMRLLDVGCGPGSITLGLAERLPGGEVVAIDRFGPRRMASLASASCCPGSYSSRKHTRCQCSMRSAASKRILGSTRSGAVRSSPQS